MDGVSVPAHGSALSTARSSSLAFTGVDVVNVEAASVIPDRTVIVIGDRITAVAPADSIRVLRDTRVVDGSGRFLIPGLWDMHVHLDDPELWPRHITPEIKERVLTQLVAHGITGVRDM